ncbi:MAG: response regulator [Thermodesulfobacteriota bacterium]|nr:response regulator [Thermodesulfobacteriota bacterium]
MGFLKILVVEDDPVTRELLRKRLVKADHDVETARNGEEALGLLKDEGYDVVLTDMMMPGEIDGIGVVEKTREMHPSTEVIVITGYASIDNVIEAMKKGASDYLQKPINFDELMFRLDKISTMQSLARDADDLREAMEVTETNASCIIQDQLLEINRLNICMSDIRGFLSDTQKDPAERIKAAMEKL